MCKKWACILCCLSLLMMGTACGAQSNAISTEENSASESSISETSKTETSSQSLSSQAQQNISSQPMDDLVESSIKPSSCEKNQESSIEQTNINTDTSQQSSSEPSSFTAQPEIESSKYSEDSINDITSENQPDKEYIAGREIDNYLQTKEQDQTLTQMHEYFLELINVLSPNDYACIEHDMISKIIGIYTMNIEKVKSIVEKHPNDTIEVRFFPAVCSKVQAEAVKKKIAELPIIKNNPDKVFDVYRYDSEDLYNIIFISVWGTFPELENWAASADYGPIEIRVVGAEKTNPA